ncbi:hypothetical protein BH20BAC1_BH20BAC1_11140 [soil metagenome]
MNFQPVVSICSAGVAVFSLILTIVNTNKQNRKWNRINLARVYVVDVKFLAFRSFQIDEFQAIQWDYYMQTIQYPETPNYDPNKVFVISWKFR